MFKLLRLRFLATTAFCLLLAASVYADPVTILPAAPTPGFTQLSFTDTNESFRWVFTWDGSALNLFEAVRGPDDQQAGVQWNGDSSIDPNSGPLIFVESDFFNFFARHITQAHPLDVQTGDPYGIRLNRNLLVKTNTFSVLNRQCLPHQHNPDPHADCYLLGYTRPNEDGPVTFEFSGVHVPEPTTLLLITTGLTGVAIKMRKRLKNRTSGQSQ